MYNLLWQQQKINKGTFSWKNAIFIYEKRTHIPLTALSAMPMKAKPLALKAQLRNANAELYMQCCCESIVSVPKPSCTDSPAESTVLWEASHSSIQGHTNSATTTTLNPYVPHRHSCGHSEMSTIRQSILF